VHTILDETGSPHQHVCKTRCSGLWRLEVRNGRGVWGTNPSMDGLSPPTLTPRLCTTRC
jgi:hypothetical protein